MKQLTRHALCSIASLTVAACCGAARADDYYAGAGIARQGSSQIVETEGGVSTRYDASHEQRLYRLFAGVNLTPEWGVELGYHGLGGKTSFDIDAGHQLRVDSNALYLAARRGWQLGEDWSLFAKAGLARGTLNLSMTGTGAPAPASVHKTGAYLGVGAAYLLGRNVALQLELDHTDQLRYQGLKASMGQVAASVRYNF